MANEVRIKLTEEQKAKIKEATGQSVGEIRVSNLGHNVAVTPNVSAKAVSARSAKEALSARSAKEALSARSAKEALSARSAKEALSARSARSGGGDENPE